MCERAAKPHNKLIFCFRFFFLFLSKFYSSPSSSCIKKCTTVYQPGPGPLQQSQGLVVIVSSFQRITTVERWCVDMLRPVFPRPVYRPSRPCTFPHVSHRHCALTLSHDRTSGTEYTVYTLYTTQFYFTPSTSRRVDE